MRMRLFATCFTSLLLLAVLPACTVIREAPVPDNLRAETESEEYRLCSDLLICFIKNDASGFVKKLAPENAKIFTEETFRKTRKETVASLGEPVSFRYLTTLEFVSHHTGIRIAETSCLGSPVPPDGPDGSGRVLQRGAVPRSDRTDEGGRGPGPQLPDPVTFFESTANY